MRGQPPRVAAGGRGRATGSRSRSRGAGAGRRAACRSRRTATQSGLLEHLDLGAIQIADRRRCRPSGSSVPNLNCLTWMMTKSSRNRPDAIIVDDAKLLRLVCPAELLLVIAGPAAPPGSPATSGPSCRCAAGRRASSPISIGMISGFEISVCEYSLNSSGPAKIMSVAGEVEDQVDEQREAGEADEELGADRGGEDTG